MTDGRGTSAGVLSATLKATLAFCSLVGTGTSIVKVDVRCYCNLPPCAATGYVCRSSAGVCASDREDGEVWGWRYACLELLPSRSEPRCEEDTTRWCCTEDMCNYFGKSSSSSLSGHHRGGSQNHSHLTDRLSNHDTSLLRGGGGGSPDPQTLFRAAVVAVPVAGGLVMLVALKMLRDDGRPRSQTTTMPVNTHWRRKNLLPKSLSCMLLGSVQPGRMVRSYASMGNVGPSGNLCQSTSLAVSTDSGCTDSSKEKYFVFDV